MAQRLSVDPSHLPSRTTIEPAGCDYFELAIEWWEVEEEIRDGDPNG
jgi:hypothetical protein